MNDNWKSCQPGELTRMVKNLRYEHTRQQQRKMIVTGTCLAGLLLVIALAVFSQPSASRSITCREVILRLDDYRQGLLDSDLAERITRHLAICPECGPKFEALQKSQTHREAALAGRVALR